MKQKFIVMAQGSGTRWDLSERTKVVPPSPSKHLIQIGDEVLISRTIRQLSLYGSVIVIGRGDDLFEYTEYAAELHTLRDAQGSSVSGMFQTREFWGEADRIVFIQGDTVFSNEVVRRVGYSETSRTVFGRKGHNKITGKQARESFAMSITLDDFDWFKSVLTETMIKNPSLQAGFGDIYKPRNFIYIDVDDYTDDIDSPEEYEQYGEILIKSAIDDDKTFYLR